MSDLSSWPPAVQKSEMLNMSINRLSYFMGLTVAEHNDENLKRRINLGWILVIFGCLGGCLGCSWLSLGVLGHLGPPVSICSGFWVTCGGSSRSLLGPLWLQISISGALDMIFW